MKKIPSLSIIGLFLLSACASEGQVVQDTTQVVNEVQEESKVYKYDESVQCGDGGVSLEEMEAELTEAGVNVFCAQAGHDGRNRPQVCGARTGNINVYTISKADVRRANELGFKWTGILHQFEDAPCSR